MNSTKASKILTFLSIFPANAGVFPGMHNSRTRVEHIPRERGGLPVRDGTIYLRSAYSPRTRGSTLCGVSGCRYANISLHMQGSTRSCAASFDHRNIPRERGGHPLFERLTFKVTGYSPRTRGSTLLDRRRCSARSIFPRECGGQPTVACPGAGMRTFPCVSRDSTAFAADLSK